MRPRLFTIGLVVSAVLAVAPPSPTLDSSSAAGDEAAVLAVVQRLFDGMRARDGEAVAAVFHPDARMVRTAQGPDGLPRVQVTGVEAFIEAVGSGTEPWDEPLFDTEVRVDQNLAQVWTRYRFYLGETFSHCGYNALLLVRLPPGGAAEVPWQIIQIADTRHTEGCLP